jgi:hypothetical protein
MGHVLLTQNTEQVAWWNVAEELLFKSFARGHHAPRRVHQPPVAICNGKLVARDE